MELKNLHFSKEWLRKTLAAEDAAGVEEPGGLMACSPELFKEMMKMTTKVKIEMLQPHMPVAIEINGKEVKVLTKVGDAYEDCVYSGHTIIVREMTSDEVATREL